MTTRREFLAGTAALVGTTVLGTKGRAGSLEGGPVMDAREFIAAYEAKVRPLEKAASLAWWNANVSGKDADFSAKEAAQNQLDAALSDREQFAALKAIRESKPTDPLLARQVDVLYLAFLEKQVDPKQGEPGGEGVQCGPREGRGPRADR